MDSSTHGISLDTSVSIPPQTSEDGETPTTKLPQEETLGWVSTEQEGRRGSMDSAVRAKRDEHNRRESYQSPGSRKDRPSSRSSSGKWIYMTSSESSGEIRVSVLYDGVTEKPIIHSPDRKKSIPSIKRTSPGRARLFSEPVPLDNVDDVDNESEEAPPVIAVSGAFREGATPPPHSPPGSAGSWDMDPRSPSVDYFCQRNLIDQLVGIESRLRSLEVNRLQDIVRNDIRMLLERVEAIAQMQHRPVQAPAYVLCAACAKHLQLHPPPTNDEPSA
ncbi:hypothetical protein EWM64_g6401 [Hericium alpestre]|uniref:Uncharacterized protein n=1 Tax=Hericium alpestre TaxID=135208 RepID=A0A4Y9ZUS8_9AGAM|nr:hypothetical protein EWM64_g6401 [Hericium alpestre]